jgi:macrolide transport system ATP-binding/permease protein
MLKDLRYAVRWLRRSPGFAAVAILSLGLGIGVNTAMFSLVDAVLLRPIPVQHPATLVDVFTSSSDGDEYATTSYPDYLDLKAQNTVFADMIGYTPMFAPLSLGDRARLVIGQLVTSNHFNVLGVAPFLGRMLVPADDAPGAERVLVISHRMWIGDFGSDRGVVGRTLQLRGQPYTIVGVAPPAFTGVIPLLVPEIWLPVVHVEEVEPAGINDNVPSPTGKTRIERRGSRWLFVKGRLKPGATLSEAQAQIPVLGTRLASAYPETNRTRRLAAFPTTDVRLLVPQSSGPIAMGSAGVMTVVGLVLLIACANVAGMLLARASARRREISVRLAIGASRGQLVRQMLIEGLVIGVSGALIAVVVAWALLQAVRAIDLPVPGDLILDVRLDRRVLLFAVLIAAVAGVVAALTPAWKASSPHLADDLRGGAPTAKLAGRRWALRDALVLGQLALTAVLLVVAGLLLRSFGASRAADVGFRIDGLAVLSADMDMMRYSPERSQQFWTQALDRVRALPGVESAAVVTPRMPFDVNYSQTSIRIDGKEYGPDDRGETVANVYVSPEYFATMSIPLVEGRNFAASDREGAPLVAVVNESMARRFWPNSSAVGRTFRLSFGTGDYTVIGVTRDHRVHTVAENPTPYLHFSALQRPSRFNHLLARTSGDAEALVFAMRRELLTLEPGLVFISSSTMEKSLETSLLPARVGAVLAAGFGGLGTLLAAIGLYGVIAFSVTRRTREIGVRMAVGADRRRVLGLIMRQGLVLVVIGAVAGLALAAAAARMLSGVLYGVGAFDPFAWTMAIGVLAAAAALANFVPALRAMRVNPVTALRAE